MKINKLPSNERLNELLYYDQNSGVIRWKVNRSNIKAGTPALRMEGDGYLCVGIDGTAYKVHRVAWAIFYGMEPNGQIDHIDGDRTNNAISNLRLATHAQNCRNSASRSKSGFKGVSLDHRRNKYYAYITINKKMHNLGRYQTAEDAARAYDAAAFAAWGDFARLNLKWVTP